MLKVGITGNIGSGKTTVSKIFELLGVPVFYSDDAAKHVMLCDAALIEGIKAAFGTQSYFDDGSLNREHIAGIVFNDDAQLKTLNALVHPAVFRAFDEWVLHQQAPYVLKESALLFESASYKMCNRSIMVSAPLELRLERVMQRDGIDRAAAEARNAKQFPEEKKIAMADDLIVNDNTRLVIPQVLELHRLYLSLAQ